MKTAEAPRMTYQPTEAGVVWADSKSPNRRGGRLRFRPSRSSLDASPISSPVKPAKDNTDLNWHIDKIMSELGEKRRLQEATTDNTAVEKARQSETPKGFVGTLNLGDTQELDMRRVLDIDSSTPVSNSSSPVEADLVSSLGLDITDWQKMLDLVGEDQVPVFGENREVDDFRVWESLVSRATAPNIPESEEVKEMGKQDILKPYISELEALFFPPKYDPAKDTLIQIIDDPDDPANPIYSNKSVGDFPPVWRAESDAAKMQKSKVLDLAELRAVVMQRMIAARELTRIIISKNLHSIAADVKSGRIIFELFVLQALSDIADGAVITYATVRDNAILAAQKANEHFQAKVQPVLAEGAVRGALEEPEPLNDKQIELDKLRVARQAVAYVLGAMILAPGFSGIKPRETKEKSSNGEKVTLEVQNQGELSAAGLIGRLAELGVVPSINTPGVKPEAGNAKIEKPFVQQRSVLVYPENLKENDMKNVQLPVNERLYRFFTLQDYGEFGVGRGETCPAQRWATKDTIGVIHTSALAWNAAHPDIRLMIADLNADGHASHRKSIDFDIYVDDDSIRIGSPKYKKEHAIELGKIFLNTGRVEIMFFNDPEVIDALNQYAKDEGLSGSTEYAANHNAHFHVRTTDTPTKEVAPSCEAKPEPKINIAWMNEKVMALAPYIIESSKEFGVDPELMAILAYIENKGEIGRDSDAGALGPLQVMPRTGAEIAEKLGLKTYNLRDPKTNIRFGTYYVSELLKRFGKPEHGPSWDMSTLLVAIGYNGGPGAANGYLKGRVIEGEGPFCESRRYGYYALGMWRERHNPTSKFFDEYNEAINHCKIDPHSFPIPSLV